MPKKQKIKTDAGVTLDAAQAAEVRKQIYEGSYSLGAPNVTVNDEEIVVTISSEVFTVHGDSTIVTTTAYECEGFEESVRNALERTRKAAEAIIKAIDDDLEENCAGPDDEDEGLREGAVASAAPAQHVPAESGDLLDDEAIVRGLNGWMTNFTETPEEFEAQFRTVIRHAEETARGDEPSYGRVGLALIREFAGAPQPDDGEWIRVPNAEYADLIAFKRRVEAADVPQPFERPVTADEGAAPAGEIDLETFVAAATGSDAAFDMSNATQDDGGPVEPGLDIDALVAAASGIDAGEIPVYTEGLCGDGAAILKDGAPMRISDIVAELNRGARTCYLVEAARELAA